MKAIDMKVKPKVVGAVDIDAAIEEAEKELADGVEPIPAEEVFALLRRKFLGEV